MLRTFLAPLLFCLALAAPASADGERPAVGDAVNGAKLFKKVGGKRRVNGAWINKYNDKAALKGISLGKAGFPKVRGDNTLDRWDVLAYLRGSNADVRDLVPDASHMLISKGELDKFALERLTDQAQLKVSAEDKKGHVYVFFSKGKPGKALKRVREKNARVRDELKPSEKVGYVVFMPLEGVRKGGYEVALAINPDMQIIAAEVRGPDGEAPEDLNQAAKRYVG